MRYVHEHPVENNDWGDFQTHRRLLGLITIGKFETQTELNELCRLHESLKVKYTSTLYDSRCILFGPTNYVQTTNNANNIDTTTVDLNKATTGHNSIKRLEDEFIPPSNFKSQAFFYPENDVCNGLEVNMTDFINSLF